MTDQKPNIRPLMATWCEAFATAGFDDQAATAVLQMVRNSPEEAKIDREQFYQTLAHQANVWHQMTLDGESLEPTILMKVVEMYREQEGIVDEE